MRGGGDLFLQRGDAGCSAFTFAGGETCCLGLTVSVSSSLSAEGAGGDERGGCSSSFLTAGNVLSPSSFILSFTSFFSSFSSTVSLSFNSTSSFSSFTSSSFFSASSSSSSPPSPWWYCDKRTCHARLQTHDTVLNWWTTLRGMKYTSSWQRRMRA